MKLHLEWQPFEEVAGAALNATEQILKKHKVQVSIADNLPLVAIDAALITRLMLSAEIAGFELSVSASDQGPGLPAGREDEIFEKIYPWQSRIQRRPKRPALILRVLQAPKPACE